MPATPKQRQCRSQCGGGRSFAMGGNRVARAAQNFVDWVAGPGLEWHHVEADDQQRAAEEGLTGGSPSTAVTRRRGSASDDDDDANGAASIQVDDVDMLASSSGGTSSTPVAVRVPSPATGKPLPQPPAFGGSTNRHGKRFVYIPSLRRSIAQRDRASVRSAAFSAFMCLVLIWVLQGAYALSVQLHAVTCGPPTPPNSAPPSTPPSPPSVTSAAPERLLYPLRDALAGHSFWFRFLFLAAAIGTNGLMLFLRRGGRDGSYSDPGFVSPDGGEVRWEAIVSLPHGNAVSLTVPEQLRRHCNACGTARPLRSRHCRDCGRCVSRFDHHCNWLGHCVGSRNYGPFLLFALVGMTYGLMGAAASIGGVVWPSACAPTAAQSAAAAEGGWTFWGPLRFFELNWLPLLIALATGGLGFGMGCLVLMHFGLAATDTTTYEFARASRLEYLTFSHALGTSWEQDFNADVELIRSPFSDGAVSNFFTVVFRRGFYSLRRAWCGAVSNLGVLHSGSADGINYFVREPFSEGPPVILDTPSVI